MSTSAYPGQEGQYRSQPPQAAPVAYQAYYPQTTAYAPLAPNGQPQPQPAYTAVPVAYPVVYSAPPPQGAVLVRTSYYHRARGCCQARHCAPVVTFFALLFFTLAIYLPFWQFAETGSGSTYRAITIGFFTYCVKGGILNGGSSDNFECHSARDLDQSSDLFNAMVKGQKVGNPMESMISLALLTSFLIAVTACCATNRRSKGWAIIPVVPSIFLIVAAALALRLHSLANSLGDAFADSPYSAPFSSYSHSSNYAFLWIGFAFAGFAIGVHARASKNFQREANGSAEGEVLAIAQPNQAPASYMGIAAA